MQKSVWLPEKGKDMEYANQKEIDKLNKILKSVDEKFRICRVDLDGNNNVIRAGLVFSAKGNKGKIGKLQKMGFEIKSRFKQTEPHTAGYATTRYRGYRMYVFMEKTLQDAEERNKLCLI